MAKLPATKGYGPGCPSCGSIRSVCLENGWSEPDDNYLRRKRCSSCDETFTTAEVVIPQGRSTFYRMDYRGRHNRRQYYRERLSKTKRQLPQLTKPSDQVHISVRVTTTGAPIRECARGHPWTAENTYVNPGSGHRACRECRRMTQRRYYQDGRRALRLKPDESLNVRQIADDRAPDKAA